MPVFSGHHIFYTQCGQRISPPETDPNPNRSRTHAGISRNVDDEVDYFDVLFSVAPELARFVPTGFRFRAPENPPRVDLPEIGRSDVARAGKRGLDADGETGPEAVNLAAWGGDSGRGSARASREIPGARGGETAEFQKSSFP